MDTIVDRDPLPEAEGAQAGPGGLEPRPEEAMPPVVLEQELASPSAGVEDDAPIELEAAFRTSRLREHPKIVAASRAGDLEIDGVPVGPAVMQERVDGFPVLFIGDPRRRR